MASCKTGKIHERHPSFPPDRPVLDDELGPILRNFYEAFRDHTDEVKLPMLIDATIKKIKKLYRLHYLGKKPNAQDRMDGANAAIAYLAGCIHAFRCADAENGEGDDIPPCPISYFSGPED